jgi:ribosome biogenesis GTPase
VFCRRPTETRAQRGTKENRTIVRNVSPASGVKEAPSAPERPAGGAHEGIVLRAISGVYVVQADTDKDSHPRRYNCTLRGNLKKTFTYSTSGSLPRRVQRAKRPFTTDTVAVGDRVRFTPMDEEEGVIEEILPRQSRFARASFRGSEQTLITNLDQLVIVFACAEPNPDLWRLDRWLVAAESYGLEPLIVANKRDLVDDATFREKFAEFTAIGYRVLGTSAPQSLGIEELRAALRGRISAFTGPSGVGKSSLLNLVQPGLHLDTGDIGHVTYKGRHTTTVRELIPLDSGGWVADTPGLRNLELLAMDRDELADCFIEFRPCLETACRFRDCRHENEPDCNLKAAVAEGRISPRRYESFLLLAREIESAKR